MWPTGKRATLRSSWAAHEGDIILHRAAKKFFDDQGLTKLPTIKEIQAEYAALQHAI